EFSVGKLSSGIDDTGALQGRLGIVEQRVENSTERVDYQETVLKQGISDLEEVDSYETAMRINELLSGIEASYSVTAKIQGLSIMNYI
ncbi:MAG: flagellar hook-associated family protein, partial [Salaquimonas sp.]|nr:flagellar hook-associated family protein [Salaquimonas sp.]